MGTLGRYRSVFESAELVSAKLELAPGPQNSITDSKTLIETRSETQETSLREILGADPSLTSGLGTVSPIRPVEGRIEGGGDEEISVPIGAGESGNGVTTGESGDDAGAGTGKIDNRPHPVSGDRRLPIEVINPPM